MAQREGFIILWKGLMRRAAKHARGLPRRTMPLAVSKSGQHMTQYAILIGLVTLAAVSMQFIVRRAMQVGVAAVSDEILEPPPPPVPPPPPGPSDPPPTTIQVQDCDGTTRSATGNRLALQTSCAQDVQTGDSTSRRVTDIQVESHGASVSDAARLQVFQE